jgi:hypothetical protein
MFWVNLHSVSVKVGSGKVRFILTVTSGEPYETF